MFFIPVIWKLCHRFQSVIHLHSLKICIYAVICTTAYADSLGNLLPVKKLHLFKVAALSPLVTDCNTTVQQLICMICSHICCCLVPQVHETVCHDTVSHIAGMIYIIKELILRQYSAFFSGQAKLRCNCILNADHGQFIGLTHNRKPIL